MLFFNNLHNYWLSLWLLILIVIIYFLLICIANIYFNDFNDFNSDYLLIHIGNYLFLLMTIGSHSD